MKNIVIVLSLLLFGCHKEQLSAPVSSVPPPQSTQVIEMAYHSIYRSDTTQTGISFTSSVIGSRNQYVFTSNSAGQNTSVTINDLNGGLIVAGDSLVSVAVSCTVRDTTFNLQTPTLCQVVDTLGIQMISLHWCVLPLNGNSMDAHIKIRQ